MFYSPFFGQDSSGGGSACTQDNTKTSMPPVGFEPRIPAIEPAKAFHGSDRAAVRVRTVAEREAYLHDVTD
jgi:hypothetical protein